MNKRFLMIIMTMTLAGTILTGCTTSKQNAPVSEGTEVITEDNTSTEEVEEGTEDITESEEVIEVEEENTTATDTEVEDNTTTEAEDVVDEAEEVYGEVDPSVAQEMLFVITDGIELPYRNNMDSVMFADTYGISPKHLSSYVVSMPMMNVHATEIAIFEVVDEKGREAVKAGIDKRVQALTEQWKSYLPEQYELVKNYQVVDKGNFVLFVISDEADAIINKFKQA